MRAFTPTAALRGSTFPLQGKVKSERHVSMDHRVKPGGDEEERRNDGRMIR
jgi:hypothetical protein